ncbi:MAG: glycine cleavage system aminomethyltransferase GcvT, partial [Bacteroidetes bacterium]|nr:glycine cleavage system aminomethyltransferase GcvT [Bacteroidota bacterium]
MSDNQALKSTALSELHTSLGAKMVPFAGFNMPVLYDNLILEHNCVRNAMGVFDVSHMGEVWVEGPKAYDLIEFITTNDVSTLYDGRVQYSCMPNATGGIVDDLIIYRISQEEYLLVVNASNIEKDWNWISSHNTDGVEMENASDAYSLLAIQGPKAAEAMQALTEVNLSEMGYYTFAKGTFAGQQNI